MPILRAVLAALVLAATLPHLAAAMPAACDPWGASCAGLGLRHPLACGQEGDAGAGGGAASRGAWGNASAQGAEDCYHHDGAGYAYDSRSLDAGAAACTGATGCAGANATWAWSEFETPTSDARTCGAEVLLQSDATGPVDERAPCACG